MEIDDEKLFEEKIKSGSNDKDDYFMLGSIYLSTAKYGKLLDLYKGLERLPLSKMEIGRKNYEKAEALQLSGQLKEAITFYNNSLKSIENEKNSTDIFFLKGMCYFHLFMLSENENGKKSIENFNFVLETHPDLQLKYQIYSYLGEIYNKYGDYQKAEYYYQLAIDHSVNKENSIWAMVGLANVYGLLGNLKKAEKLFKKSLKEASEKTSISKIYHEMGKVFFNSNLFLKAKEAFKNALQYRTDNPSLKENSYYYIEIIWHLGSIAYEVNDYDESLKFLKDIVKMMDRDHIYYTSTNITLGHLYSYFENYQMAREHYSNVLSVSYITPEEQDKVTGWLKNIPLDS